MFRLFLILFVIPAICFSQSPERKLSEKDVDNLILCIESENDGIRSWGVFFAGKYRVGETVIPLMKVLHEDDNVAIRKLAVHSLFRIGDNRGIFAIKGSAKHDTSREVRELCLSMVQSFDYMLQPEK